MEERQREIIALIVGPAIWISSVALMIHGLWIGAWYGYAFGTVLLVAAVTVLVSMYCIRRSVEAEFERRINR